MKCVQAVFRFIVQDGGIIKFWEGDLEVACMKDEMGEGTKTFVINYTVQERTKVYKFLEQNRERTRTEQIGLIVFLIF